MTASTNVEDQCTHAEEQLQAYLDGMLSVEVVAVIDRHLETCEPCARALHRHAMRSCTSIATDSIVTSWNPRRGRLTPS